MKKKIIIMLLCVGMGTCMGSMMPAEAGAADFSSGASDSGELFSDGTKEQNSGEGDISQFADRIADHAEAQALEYQEIQDEAQKAADAKEVQRRAQEVKEKTSEIRRKAKAEAARKAEEQRKAHRQEIVDFALQFEGNPYVYGGTSLTNGADCSGFVMSVFKEFGYELPRVASAQYEASHKKDVSQIETGDLVFYGSGGIGHVALYIGNGRIIHASTSASGIKISDYDYETPVGVGTYLK